MQCPECKSIRIIVDDVRKTYTKNGRRFERFLKGNVIVRRRLCLRCAHRFWTVEKVIYNEAI